MGDDMNPKENVYNGMFDISKMVLAIFVVAIHAHLLPEILNPLIRMAVPLFFMMSSYFFFSRGAKLRKFWGRNLRLYGFWFVFLLPVTLKIRHYFENGFLQGILKMLQNFLFYSTFRASWYIIALCSAVTIVFLLSKKLSNTTMLAMSVPVYLLFCLFSNYYRLMERFPGWVSFCEGYQTVFVTLCNNFPVAFIWIVLGKMFAEDQIPLTVTGSSRLLLISSVLLIAEHLLILHFELAAATDCYIFLIPLCVAVFSLICHSQITGNRAPLLRKMSTITYVLHSSSIVVIDVVALKLLHLEGQLLAVVEFAAAIAVCAAAAWIISRLEEYRCFRWLKWAY